MKEAFDLVVEYLQLDYEILDTELDDFLLEIAYEVISVLGDDRVEEIKRIIKDKTVNNYVRGTFSSTLAFLTYIEKTDRESTKEFYKEIFEDKNEDLELKYYMTDDLEKLGLKEFRDVIKKVEDNIGKEQSNGDEPNLEQPKPEPQQQPQETQKPEQQQQLPPKMESKAVNPNRKVVKESETIDALIEKYLNGEDDDLEVIHTKTKNKIFKTPEFK
jgi:hypothetical protein